VSTGRFKAIDGMRRRARFDRSLEELTRRPESAALESSSTDEEVEDDRLSLIFTCCHPALPVDAQLASTLRKVYGLTTEEIARAFLTRPPTNAQRIVRAKGKIRDARIPYQVPSRSGLPERLNAVLYVVCLFNEGYFASSGSELTRRDLSSEAIRLGRLLVELALMLLHESRRLARTTADSDLVLLDHQNRLLWNRALIVEGIRLVERALLSRRFGPYSPQAAISGGACGSGASREYRLETDRRVVRRPAPCRSLFCR